MSGLNLDYDDDDDDDDGDGGDDDNDAGGGGGGGDDDDDDDDDECVCVCVFSLRHLCKTGALNTCTHTHARTGTHHSLVWNFACTIYELTLLRLYHTFI